MSLHFKTPCRQSNVLSKKVGCKVYLKFENCQPSGSFKIRGVGYMCQKSVEAGCKQLVCSSGGNAGLAAAYAANKLNTPITIFVPKTTSELTVNRLKEEGANVNVVGAVWDEANEAALQFAEKDGFSYVPPFDHPLLWKGHSSVISELEEKPDLVVCSVGGGGLLCGVVEGLKARGWNDVVVLAAETFGADSLNKAIKAGHLITLPGIDSIAKSLGAKTVCQAALDAFKNHPLVSCCVSDKDVVSSMCQFLDDEKVLVEPACAASLSVFYNDYFLELQNENELLKKVQNILVIVCGGTQVTTQLLEKWKKDFCC